MADGGIILQIFFITLGMFAVGLIFNKIFGLNREEIRKIQEKAKNIQERMRNAQLVGDARMMQQIQQDSMELTKEMMKKQFIPLCARCILFLGIFAVLGLIYSPYNEGLLPFPILFFGTGWVAIYLLFSLGISLTYFVGKKLYQKATGKESKGPGLTGEMMNMLSPNQDTTSEIMDYSKAISPDERKEQEGESNALKKKDSWKEKLDS
ncbi:MAG: conserved membrane protein of unknown function [Promethearchaeota archaeon]|jgi:hypothetical protein|nr:MAG: conserved membrane protein of unknown function [Candidatus Lokiarchaeota archaeon]